MKKNILEKMRAGDFSVSMENSVEKKSFFSLKAFFIILFSLVILFPSFSQVSTDPNHRFYSECERWRIMGLVEDLPILRPYSLQTVNSVLLQVMENENSEEAENAKELYEEVNGKKWHISAGGEFYLSAKDGSYETMTGLEPKLYGDMFLYSNLLSIGYSLGLDTRTKTDVSSVYPLYTRNLRDSIQDPARIGSFVSYIDGNEAASFGKENLYVQAGVYRNGTGYFPSQGLALNESSYHAANISFNYVSNFISFSTLLSSLGATSSYSSALNTLSGNKFMSFHEIDFKINNRLSVGYYETIVFGQRFDPSYIFPVPYMITQGINGCSDNLQMGLNIAYRPWNFIRFAADVFVDDLSVNQLFKFNFDSKNRLGAQAGISMAFSGVLRSAEITGTIITPYTYSHWQFEDNTSHLILPDAVNYQDYTNNGMSMGSSYDPNTAALSFKTSFVLAKRLTMDFYGTGLIHGNAAENFTDDEAVEYLLAEEHTYATDGTINMNSMMSGDNSVDTAWNHLNFLTQNHKMKFFQLGLSYRYSLPNFKVGSMTFIASITSQFVSNLGVNENIFPGGQIIANEDGSYTWGSYTYAGKAELIAAKPVIAKYYRDLWISGLSEEVSIFFKFGASYRF